MNPAVKRRRVVRAVSGGIAFGLAGCVGGEGDGNGPTDTPAGDPTGTNDDERAVDGPGSDGLLYAFGPDRAVAIDPEEGEVVAELGADFQDRDWGDARLTHDRRKLFVVEGSLGQVAVVDTETRELVEWVDIGSGPTHAYLPVEDELWAHADGEGAFYVVDTETHQVTEIVQSGLESQGHGKLISHEDLYPKAYATNTNDPAGLIIDLDAYERTGHVDFGGDGGTHYAAYAPHTGLVYFEQTRADDMPVVDAETDDVVDRLDFSGGLSVSPDGTILGVWDGNDVHFVDATSEESDLLGSVSLGERGPDDIEFYEDGGKWHAITANTLTDDVSVIDVDEGVILDHIPAGAIERPDGARFLHRDGALGDGYYFTPAGADGTVAIIDVAARELLHEVEVGTGVDTISYIGTGDT